MDSPLIWVQAVMLAAARLTVGLGLTPLFSAFAMPMLARLIFILVLSSLAVDVQGTLPPAADLAAMVPALCNEVGLGLLLSVGVHAAFAAFSIGGRLIDAQMGFTLGAVLDPVSKGHAAVMASGLNLLAVVLFFVTDAHQLLLTGCFRTFELLPLGQGWSAQGWFPVAMGAGSMFALGFMMAAPVVIGLLLADVVVAVVSRNLPQMNVLFLSIPMKVLLGLVVMAVSVHFMSPLAARALALPVHLLDKVQ